MRAPPTKDFFFRNCELKKRFCHKLIKIKMQKIMAGRHHSLLIMLHGNVKLNYTKPIGRESAGRDPTE